MSGTDPVSLLRSAASMPAEGHDADWLRLMNDVLKMPGCYLPAAQEVLRQKRWLQYTGRGQNPVGYVKKATYQQALRMGLALDKYDSREPRVLTKDAPTRKAPATRRQVSEPVGMRQVRRTLRSAGLRPEVKLWWSENKLVLMEDGAETCFLYAGETPMDAVRALLAASQKQGEASGLFDVPDDLRFNALDRRRGHVALPVSPNEDPEVCIDRFSQRFEGMLVQTETGAWHQGGYQPLNDEGIEIPGWLQRDGERDAVNWEAVAQHVVRKPKMVPAVARVLELRATGVSRPRAVAGAKSREESREIESAWKWVDREWDGRIVPLFRKEKPPGVTGPENGALPVKTIRALRGFVAPGQALSQISERRSPKSDLTPAPSIEKRDRLRLLTESVGLREEVRVAWNGRSLSLTIDGPDRWTRRGLAIETDTLDEAIDALREIAEDGSVPELFHAPSSTCSQMSQNRPSERI